LDAAGVSQPVDPFGERVRLRDEPRHSPPMRGDHDSRTHFHVAHTLAQLRFELADTHPAFSHGRPTLDEATFYCMRIQKVGLPRLLFEPVSFFVSPSIMVATHPIQN